MRKLSLQPSQARAGTLQPQLQQAGKLSVKRQFCRDMLCYLVGFGNGGREEEDRQISGLYKRTSPTEVFLTGQRYKNGFLQIDSVGFEEYRKVQRIILS